VELRTAAAIALQSPTTRVACGPARRSISRGLKTGAANRCFPSRRTCWPAARHVGALFEGALRRPRQIFHRIGSVPQFRQLGCGKQRLTMRDCSCYICKVPRVHSGLSVRAGVFAFAGWRTEGPVRTQRSSRNTRRSGSLGFRPEGALAETLRATFCLSEVLSARL